MTNSDVMIEKDPELQEQLKIYAVRMPNQGLTDDDARRIYEYLRKNDN
jgi:Na+/phosphate symporter